MAHTPIINLTTLLLVGIATATFLAARIRNHQQLAKKAKTSILKLNAATSKQVNMVLGTMLFGGQVKTPEEATKHIELLLEYCKSNQTEPAIIDTARLYQKGQTEQVIGKILQEHPEWREQNRLRIHTKADPGITPLNREGLKKQLETSLSALGVSYVDVLYMHMPDTSVPIEETFATCNDFVKQGLVREIGLSNYPSWMVVEIHHLCKENGWTVPTIYQGVYHLFSRSMEYELIPALRYLKMRLHIFSPLCGGLLTGRYSNIEQAKHLTSGRFSPEYHNHHLYVERYWVPEIFQGLEKLLQICKEQDVSLTSVALRWLKHHSRLRPGDGIVFSASNLEQAQENFSSSNEGPLNPAILKVIDQVADIVRPVEAQYFRGYDKKHGRSDRWLDSLLKE